MDERDFAPGLGLDLVDLDRFRRALERGGEAFLRRIFTAAERAECARRPDPAPHLAARFAAKEAAMKALGTGWTRGVAFLDLEVRSDGARPPSLEVRGRAAEVLAEQGFRGLRVSLTHTARTAGAVVQAVAGD